MVALAGAAMVVKVARLCPCHSRIMFVRAYALVETAISGTPADAPRVGG